MKKTLIAFAALSAIAGVAHAQSSVTLYGIADVYLGQKSSKTTTAGVEVKQPSQTVIDSGGLNGSRWGLRGSEDLGGGMKAVFQLENGFDISNGAGAPGVLFDRQAFVGLSGGFGTVSLGRQYTAYDTLRGATNNVFDSTFAATGGAWANGVADYSNRVNNSIAYTSPSFGGFSGQVVASVGENKLTGLSATKNHSLHLKYANGPLLVGFAHQTENNRNAAVVAVPAVVGPPAVAAVAAVAANNSADRKYNMVAASYDFGVAALQTGFNVAKQGSRDDKEFQLGVSVPFGAASIAVGAARSKSELGGVSTTGTGFGAAAVYNLSKRTSMYAGLNANKAVSGTSNTKTSLVAVGVRHTF